MMSCDVPTEKCSCGWVLVNWTYLCHQHIDFKNLSTSTTGKHCLGAAGNDGSLHCYSLVWMVRLDFRDLLWGNFWLSQAVCCCSLFLTIQSLMLPIAHRVFAMGFHNDARSLPNPHHEHIHGIIYIWLIGHTLFSKVFSLKNNNCLFRGFFLVILIDLSFRSKLKLLFLLRIYAC